MTSVISELLLIPQSPARFSILFEALISGPRAGMSLCAWHSVAVRSVSAEVMPISASEPSLLTGGI